MSDLGNGATLELEFLPAGSGDSIHIRYRGDRGSMRNIVVDGGGSRQDYERGLKRTVAALASAGERIDLLVATHYDDDHLKGLLWLAQDLSAGEFSEDLATMVRSTWFHAPGPDRHSSTASVGRHELSVATAVRLAELLPVQSVAEPYREPPWSFSVHGARLTALSPAPCDLESYFANLNQSPRRRELSRTPMQAKVDMRELIKTSGFSSRRASNYYISREQKFDLVHLPARRALCSSFR